MPFRLPRLENLLFHHDWYAASSPELFLTRGLAWKIPKTKAADQPKVDQFHGHPFYISENPAK